MYNISYVLHIYKSLSIYIYICIVGDLAKVFGAFECKDWDTHGRQDSLHSTQTELQRRHAARDTQAHYDLGWENAGRTTCHDLCSVRFQGAHVITKQEKPTITSWQWRRILARRITSKEPCMQDFGRGTEFARHQSLNLRDRRCVYGRCGGLPHRIQKAFFASGEALLELFWLTSLLG